MTPEERKDPYGLPGDEIPGLPLIDPSAETEAIDGLMKTLSAGPDGTPAPEEAPGGAETGAEAPGAEPALPDPWAQADAAETGEKAPVTEPALPDPWAEAGAVETGEAAPGAEPAEAASPAETGAADAGETVPGAEPGTAVPAQEPAVPPQEPAAQKIVPSNSPEYRLMQDAHFREVAALEAEYEEQRHIPVDLGPEDGVDVYLARRVGAGHVLKRQPCQDFCLSRPLPRGAVMCLADGVSACPRSDHGARIACETAADLVLALAEKGLPEEEFLRTLCSLDFYAEIVRTWQTRIGEHWAANPVTEEELARTEAEKRSAFQREPRLIYGSTLLFGVLTPHWWAARNLGDGQVLLFNGEEFLRLRISDKETSATQGLMYGDCLEHVQTGVWPREAFQGMLLTSDGMGDMLLKRQSSAQCWLAWARQLTERCRRDGKPTLPFVYKGIFGDQERSVDLSRQMGASDDFSVALMLDRRERDDTLLREIHGFIRRQLGEGTDIFLCRLAGDMRIYRLAGEQGTWMLCVEPLDAPRLRQHPRIGHLGGKRVSRRLRAWRSERLGLYCSLYPMEPGFVTLEEAMQGSHFCSKPQSARTSRGVTVDPDISAPLALIWQRLESTREQLARLGLRLRADASLLLLVNPGTQEICIPSAALLPAEAEEAAEKTPWHLSPDLLSPALMGFLRWDDGACTPLFSPGLDDSGYPCYVHAWSEHKDLNPAFCQPVRSRSGLTLRNISQSAWELAEPDGGTAQVLPRKLMLLKEGRRITFARGDGTRGSCSLAGIRRPPDLEAETGSGN